MDKLREWADAVMQHQAGESDRALASVGWSYNDLELMQPFFEAFAGTPTRNEDVRSAIRRVQGTTRRTSCASSAVISEPKASSVRMAKKALSSEK